MGQSRTVETIADRRIAGSDREIGRPKAGMMTRCTRRVRCRGA
jgi:hypothetical protein